MNDLVEKQQVDVIIDLRRSTDLVRKADSTLSPSAERQAIDYINKRLEATAATRTIN